MKTTGVSDIPKFGLLDFLGHPTTEVQERMEATKWRMGKGSMCSSTLLNTAGRKVTRKTTKMVSMVFVSCKSSLRCMRITARLLGYETGVEMPTWRL